MKSKWTTRTELKYRGKFITNNCFVSWGSFLERPGNLSGPKSNSWNNDALKLSWKAALLICLRWKKGQNNCQVSKHQTCSYWRYKEIFGTRKVSGLRETGPWRFLMFTTINSHICTNSNKREKLKGSQKNKSKQDLNSRTDSFAPQRYARALAGTGKDYGTESKEIVYVTFRVWPE